jgi:hypothetical protein
LRSSFLLLTVSAVGMLGGAYLIGRWAVGLVTLLLSAGVLVLVLLRDDGTPKPGPQAATLRPPANEDEALQRMFDQQRSLS